LDPALLEIWDTGSGTIEVLWRVPASQPAASPLRPVFPEGCREISEHTATRLPQSVVERWRIDCAGRSLAGRQIGVEGLAARRTDALVRVHVVDGRLSQTVLRGDSPFFTVPQSSGRWQVIGTYLTLGIEHILTGLDHLLFVLALVLLVGGARRLITTVTAFTVGHSVTLSLAVLGFVHIPPRPVEALIALTIFAVAVELARAAGGRTPWLGRVPWAMAFCFGLLHGLGFAGALAQVGLPEREIPLALFSFNMGIEVGQLLFILTVIAGRSALRLFPASWLKARALTPAYTIGSLSAFWFFQRTAAIFLG
jgi:hydrogenase/urease accessory protein HupE